MQIKALSAGAASLSRKGWTAMQLPNTLLRYPGIEEVFYTIAGWINNYRRTAYARAELREVGGDDIARIAHDLNVTPGELSNLVNKGPGSVSLLYKMLKALGIDRDDKNLRDPRMTRDLERLCLACGHKARCAHELDVGTAKDHYREFCLNAYTLDVLTGRVH
jgi:hypothetical protein